MKDIAPAASLDVLGLLCPVPVIRAAKRIRELGVGDVLEVVADDPLILVDLPSWCVAQGQEYLGADKDGKTVRLYVRRAR